MNMSQFSTKPILSPYAMPLIGGGGGGGGAKKKSLGADEVLKRRRRRRYYTCSIYFFFVINIFAWKFLENDSIYWKF